MPRPLPIPPKRDTPTVQRMNDGDVAFWVHRQLRWTPFMTRRTATAVSRPRHLGEDRVPARRKTLRSQQTKHRRDVHDVGRRFGVMALAQKRFLGSDGSITAAGGHGRGSITSKYGTFRGM